MKMITFLLFFCLVLSAFNRSLAQEQQQENSLQAFENLIGGTWEGQGNWSDGSPFNQQVEFEWGLSGNMVKTKTYGITGQDSGSWGLRSEGVRIENSETSELLFWEFDIRGGITEGTVFTDGKNIYLEYEYNFGTGSATLTDAWLFVDTDTYEFIVGVFADGEWTQKYLTTKLKRS